MDSDTSNPPTFHMSSFSLVDQRFPTHPLNGKIHWFTEQEFLKPSLVVVVALQFEDNPRPCVQSQRSDSSHMFSQPSTIKNVIFHFMPKQGPNAKDKGNTTSRMVWKPWYCPTFQTFLIPKPSRILLPFSSTLVMNLGSNMTSNKLSKSIELKKFLRKVSLSWR